MTTQISGDTGVSQCQPASVSQDDLRSGVVGKGPAFKAVWTANQTGITAGSWVVGKGAENFDTSNAYDPATGRFTPSVAGYYSVSWNANFNATGGLTAQTTAISKNGNLTDFVGYSSGMAQSAVAGQTGGATLTYLDGVSDYLEMRVFANVGAAGVFLSSNLSATYWAAALVRAA
jgi:hypothetical protein